MIAVVFELPWFTAFVIKVIAADKSDAGAVPVKPGCDVQFELFEAVCSPIFVGHAAGLCSPPQ